MYFKEKQFGMCLNAPIDVYDYELPSIIVSEEKYNRWINNCKKNKTSSSWIYLPERRKVYYNGDCLIYNGLHKGQWGFIEKEEDTDSD